MVTDSTEWSQLTTAAYCWYNNDEATYGEAYGALYNWYTVETGNLCPTGWHVPGDAEWTMLTEYVGGTETAGGMLKESGTDHWLNPNNGATNEYGFAALPGGYRSAASGEFDLVETNCSWWSATEVNNFDTWTRFLYNESIRVDRGWGIWKYGFSVRCIKD